MDNNEEFNPQTLIEWTEALAAESVGEMTLEERLSIFRTTVEAFMDSKVIDQVDISNPNLNESFDVVSQTLYMCHLVLKVFPQAYAEVSDQLDEAVAEKETRKDNIESLKRAFEL